ncbi:PBECR2 nuclease fold domain-containing protein [Oceanibaculum indicum]|uniref:Mu-like prophage Flumu F protein n=1 Tax=Oceanibaculum indicum P24 TaxID=1207063 RepID=K2JSI3_9PROT|nr:PBECR2 nuclease fold domain-containing protein [Oceanibaculum indicum]EKE78438.1 mu-like prophage Flumu F protein [Oceanibaculum indicum P24]
MTIGEGLPAAPAAPVHFTEAIDYLRGKVRLPTRAWTDLWEGQHARGFVVAGAQTDALLADFHQAVTRATAEGRTLQQFREDFDRIVAAHGWSYNGSRGWRSRVIFQTNMRMAYAAGRWKQVQENKRTRPYLRYLAVKDSRTRPEHMALHGLVLPADDPFWERMYPPNGWNCRCTVQSLNARDLERYGYEVGTAPEIEEEARQINTPDGQVTVTVPKGVDPGFAYNPGQAAWGRGAQSVAMERHGGWDELVAPGAPSYSLDPLSATAPRAQLAPRVRQGDEVALRTLLRRSIGGDERIFADPSGAAVAVTQAVADHIVADSKRWDGRETYWPLIPELLTAPQEIWVGFARSTASGRVGLRRRYVRMVALDKDRAVALVADAEGGLWQAMTFFRGSARALGNIRKGLLIYRE